MKTRSLVGIAISALCVAAGSAHAGVIDLTAPNSSGAVDGTFFETADFRPAGTGYITSFVRIRANGIEEGYNTSGRPVAFDELTDHNFTRDLQLSEVPIVGIEGTQYYEFRLDINQSNGQNNALLSLDEARIYTSPTGSQTTSNTGSLGALRFDLDAGTDHWVKLNYDLESGSGQGDMVMLVPVSKFSGAAGTDFLYLYSKFGVNDKANAGFEEWSVRSVPAPGALGLATIGVFLLVGRRRGAK